MKLFIELRGLIQCTKLHDHAVCYIQSRRPRIDAFIILGKKRRPLPELRDVLATFHYISGYT